MPKEIDPELTARAVRLFSQRIGGYPSLTAASAVVAERLGFGKESVRPWAGRRRCTRGRHEEGAG